MVFLPLRSRVLNTTIYGRQWRLYQSLKGRGELKLNDEQTTSPIILLLYPRLANVHHEYVSQKTETYVNDKKYNGKHVLEIFVGGLARR